MSPSGQLARAKARWVRNRAEQRKRRPREGMGTYAPAVMLGVLGIGTVGMLLLATTMLSPASGGLGDTSGMDAAGERFLKQHGGELRYLLEDAKSGDATRRERAMKRYDALLKTAPRSVKIALAKRYA